ncbi:TonB-dependent siderophore receptor [Roseivirga sp. E12]|uniref:TonB-dependent receptor plug domain-containing protein n=1 Tax=Roseivirga sp. E12 TaxID=2819237 RepID=UPI001ABD33A3|nr:TonB-dependent receptor plug domain-containing protein [Roseivirga sp. E12]MBO3699686.1 TonB-dependent receptor [Roseivirga sp. E12]
MTKIRMRGAILLVLLSMGFLSYAQERNDTTDLGEFVVTGTRFRTPVEKSGKTIYKLTRAFIDKSPGKTVADLLNEVPAVQTDGNFGTPGTNIEYYVRGARSKYTLVLIDGVPMNDPTGISLFYDLRYLPANQVESIEILKGGLSALYGSNAAAGVINITLRDNAQEPIRGSVDVNGGSFGALGINANVNGTRNDFNYGVSFNRTSFDGFSAAAQNDPTASFDDDGFEKTNVLFKGGYQASDQFDIDFTVAYDDFKADIDAFSFTDELNAFADYQQFRFGIRPRLSFKNGRSALNISYINNERIFQNAFPSTFEGVNFQLDQTNEFEISEYAKALFGVNVQRLKNNSENQEGDFTIVDPYASIVLESDHGLNFHFGLRLNTHSDYDNQLMTTVNPSWLIDVSNDISIKPFMSISNAYNTPSLFQINSPFFGNSDLSPESTNSYEFGTALYAKSGLTYNFAFFRRDEDNAIDFLSIFDNGGNFIGGNYINLDSRREVQGIETDVTWEINSKVTLTANYSKLATNNDALFSRIPKEKYGVGLLFTPIEASSVNIRYNYTGERRVSPFSDNLLDSYSLVDIALRKQFLSKKLTAYGAINNIFDEEFVGVVGFTTMGRNYTIGLNFDF